MKRLALALALLLLLPTVVLAGTATLNWTAPTLNEDGTPYIDPDGYKIYFGLTDGGPYPTEVDIPDHLTLTTDIEDLSAGTYYFVATAYNTQAIESTFSNQATKVLSSVPSAPLNLTVSGDLIAYSISQTEDRLVTYPVGTVPEGTPCDGSMSANGLNLVPVAAVEFAPGADATVAFAQCGAG